MNLENKQEQNIATCKALFCCSSILLHTGDKILSVILVFGLMGSFCVHQVFLKPVLVMKVACTIYNMVEVAGYH